MIVGVSTDEVRRLREMLDDIEEGEYIDFDFNGYEVRKVRTSVDKGPHYDFKGRKADGDVVTEVYLIKLCYRRPSS